VVKPDAVRLAGDGAFEIATAGKPDGYRPRLIRMTITVA
jgi:hypothetical protein